MAVAVNPVTNKIYVANDNSTNVTVIDGATNATTTVTAGTESAGRGREPGDQQDLRGELLAGNNVTVIDGATNTTTTVTAGIRSRCRGGEPGDQQNLRGEYRLTATSR